MDGLKRYDLYFDGYKAEMQEQDHDSHGEYVKYSDIEPLIEAVKFYANEENWRSDGGLDFHQHVREKIKNDKWYPNNDEQHPYSEIRGGKTAREALKKVMNGNYAIKKSRG